MRKQKNVDEYIHSFPEDTRPLLFELRKRIKNLVPEVQESISYGMPAYKLHGKPLVYFAGFKHHIGFYATPSGHAEFSEELLQFKHGKGSVQFPLDAPIPFDLIQKIIAFISKEIILQNVKK